MKALSIRRRSSWEANMDPETTLVLLDEWHNRGDFMLAPADPDPLRSWRTARYIVRRFCGPVWEARKLDKPMGHDWRHDASQLAGGPWVEILQPQPYATGRAELAARTMARSLVLIADRYCGGPGEAKRCLDKLPAAFVESTRAELRAEEEAAREKQRAEAATCPVCHQELLECQVGIGHWTACACGDSVTSPVFGDDASEPTGRQTEPDPPGVTETWPGVEPLKHRPLKALGKAAAGRALIAPARQTNERYPRGWHPEDEER